MAMNIVPNEPWSDLVALQLAIDRIMTERLTMIGKVGERIVDLTHQKILTVIKTSYL